MNLKSKILNALPARIQQKLHHRNRMKVFMKGYNTFLQTGKTPHDAHMALIDLFCSTNGSFNKTFNDKIGLQYPPVKVNSDLEGVAGHFTAKDFAEINSELNQKGYFVFEKKLSKEFCDRLYKFALETPASIPNSPNKILYDPNSPVAESYRFDMQDMINNPEVQQLVMDPVLLNVARNYLGCEPIFDYTTMMWTSAFNKEPSAEAAQLYHFDMDRIKWLKVFFYINEVTPENGPHCYVEGTHIPGVKPEKLLQRGYARIKDEELRPFYKAEEMKMICGEAGSIILGDTKCWHKGKNITKGHRLLMDFEYTSSLFGANYPKLEVVNPADNFRDFCKSNPRFASNIQIKN